MQIELRQMHKRDSLYLMSEYYKLRHFLRRLRTKMLIIQQLFKSMPCIMPILLWARLKPMPNVFPNITASSQRLRGIMLFRLFRIRQ
jgi:hypothetical protein